MLIASDWLDDVRWPDRKVFVDLKQHQIENGPEYDPSAAVQRSYEEALYSHYAIPPYWRKMIEEEPLTK